LQKISAMNRLEKQLIRHEGIKLHPYYCPAGKITIGIGRNLEDRGICESEAMLMLINDITQAKDDVNTLLDYYRVCKWHLNPARLDALANLAFNLGRRGLGGFKKMFHCLKNDDFPGAAEQLLCSRYAIQVGNRAIELANQIEKGRYDDGI